MTTEGSWVVTILIVGSACGIVYETFRWFNRWRDERAERRHRHAHRPNPIERVANAVKARTRA